MDVLYRVKAGRTNESLRYSLRSLANLGTGRHTVHMVGPLLPPWVHNVDHIQTGQWRQGKHFALVADLVTAARTMGTTEFVLIDDDMFVLCPTTLPTLHGGPLDTQDKVASAYGRSKQRTEYVLRGMGITNPLDYELHVPMAMLADAVVDTLAPLVDSVRPIQARSLYGNVRGIGGRRAPDVKVRHASDALPTPFASTAPSTWPLFRSAIAQQLPDASPYE